MTLDLVQRFSQPGSCIRVVHSLNGLELFAVGVLVRSGPEHITIEQRSDQYGPIEPFLLKIPWTSVIRLTVNGPAAAASARAGMHVA